jgi:peptide/nickel transport system permease protein
MSSWSFLIKRIIQTIITLFVVLILLFVIFRLMPGDPAKFFIQPGTAPETFHLIAVKYGFEKEELAPGNNYVTTIDTSLVGAYGLEFTADDNAGNTASYYSTHNKYGLLKIDDNTSTSTNITLVTQPSIGSQIGVSMELLCDLTCPMQFPVNVTDSGGVFETIILAKGFNETIGTQERAEYAGTSTQVLSEVGNYFISFEAEDEFGTSISNIYGFSLNKSPSELSPFVFGNLFIGQLAESDTTSEVTITITSTTSITETELALNTPDDFSRIYTISRLTRFVPVPYWEQFAIYMKNMLTFDFGNSFVSGRAVWDELNQRIPPTLLLFGSALLLSSTLGVLFGAVMAWRRGSKTEIGGIVVSLFFYSMPIFWFGLILLAVFGFYLDWFPLRGMLTPGASYQGLDYVADILWHLTLPLITLTMGSLAGWLLLMRNSMLEVMGEDYITTAKAKGLTDRKVMYRHAARNAMLPIVTSIALSVGHIIGGGVLTETIFSWPGMGQYLVFSTFSYDFPAVQGAFFLLAILTIVGNFIADILYAYLDPRVRLTR